MKIPTPRFALRLSVLLSFFLCMLSSLGSAQHCEALAQQFDLAKLEVSALSELSEAIFMGKAGKELSAEQRLCVLHEVEAELMAEYAYEPLIGLGRKLEMLADLDAPLLPEFELQNYEYLAKAYSELGAADSCVYFSNRAEAFLDPQVEEELVRLLAIRQPKLMGYIDLLQFDKAEQMLVESEAWIKATGKERAEWGRFYYDKAVIFNYREEVENALSEMKKCVEVIKPVKEQFPNLYAKSCSSVGKFLSSLGKLENAETLLTEALIFSKENENIDIKSQVIVYCNLSQLYSYKKQISKSQEMIQNAKELATEMKSSPFFLPKIYLFEMGNYLDHSDLEMAIKACDSGYKTLKNIDKGLSHKNLSASFSSAISFLSQDYFSLTGDSSYLVKSKFAALDHFDYLKLLSVKSNYFGSRFTMVPYEIDESKYILNFIKSSNELDLNKNQFLFDFFEFEKSQQINFKHYFDSYEKGKTVDEGQVDVLEKSQLEKFSIDDRSKIDEYLGAVHVRNKEKNKIDAVFSQLKTSNANSRYNKFLNFSKTRNEIFVNYFVEKKHLNILTCYKGSANHRVVDVSKDSLNVLCQKYIDQLREIKSLEDSGRKFNSLSRQLYDILLGSIDISVSANLIVIPHGILNRVAFESLCKSNGDSENEGEWDLNYLAKTHNVSYANSMLSLLFQETLEFEKSVDGMVAFAPEFSNAEELKSVRKGLSKLKYNIPEAKYAVEIFSGKLFVGAEANLANLELHGPSTGVIHLATHTFMDEGNSFPGIVLANEGQSGHGTYHIGKTFENGLEAKMVVLSACQTALGPIEFGDGMVGIPQSLMKIGVPSVISSLWEINDKSTMEVMNAFYDNLKKGNSIPESLGDAKRTYINVNSGIQKHPYFWAGVISNGRTQSPIERDRKMIFLSIFGIICLTAIFWVFKKR